MSFQSPHLLWLLVPLVLLFSWELARHTARAATTFPKIARAWAGAFNVSMGARHTTAENRPRIWLWFGLALCIVAFARPQWGMIEEQVFDQSREVLIAVDLSKSMLAQDVKPSRLDRSKLLIQSLLDGLKGERVGLVVFAGTAFLQSPLSSDYEILREFLPAMGPDYLPEGGTNYRALLETSIQAFGTSTADRYLIILSDGEATDDDWRPLVDQLKAKGIRVIGLGVGTQQGGFIPDPSGGFVKDERGAVVLARLNSSTLEELAQVTGGAYTDASAWVDLPALLKKTVETGTKGDFTEKNTARKIERFQWFLAPGLLLLLISFWAEFPVRPRERALPLSATAGRPKSPGKSAATVTAASLALLFALGVPHRAEGEDSPAETLSKPLATTVARLSEQPSLSAKDYSDLAQTTITYGQRAKSAKQLPVERAVQDALQAVDLGEKLDAKEADWAKLRQDLNELLKKEEPPPQDKKKQDEEQKKKDQQKQDQNKDQQKNQDKDQPKDQDKNKSDQQKQDEKDQQQKPQDQPPQSPQKNAKDAFGDMKDKPDQKAPPPPPPQSGTQKVGGQQDQKHEDQTTPEMAIPLQKLEQVKNQDSPAKLQQIMQSQEQSQQKPKTVGKDW
ncbi:MAG: VWA domain-containing protein [Lacunisphaera sp.]